MKRIHEEMMALIRVTPMSVSDMAQTLGVSRRYIGLILQAHRSHIARMNYYIADYERTEGTMVPLYRYGRGVDCEKPAAKDRKQSCADWYQRNKTALRMKRQAKEGKKATPWDGLLNKC